MSLQKGPWKTKSGSDWPHSSFLNGQDGVGFGFPAECSVLLGLDWRPLNIYSFNNIGRVPGRYAGKAVSKVSQPVQRES